LSNEQCDACGLLAIPEGGRKCKWCGAYRRNKA